MFWRKKRVVWHAYNYVLTGDKGSGALRVSVYKGFTGVAYLCIRVRGIVNTEVRLTHSATVSANQQRVLELATQALYKCGIVRRGDRVQSSCAGYRKDVKFRRTQ